MTNASPWVLSVAGALPLLLPCPLTKSAPNQAAPSHALGPRQALVYERSAERLDAREPRRGQPRLHWVREMAPPVLFGGELSVDKRRLATPIFDLRELVPHAAFDVRTLGRGGELHYEIENLNGLKPHDVKLRWSRPAKDGVQKAKGSIRPAKPRANERYVNDEQVRVRGTIELTRVWDREKRRVDSFEGRLELRWSGPHTRSRVEFRERWSKPQLLEPGSEELRQRVGNAHARFQEQLRTSLARMLDSKPERPSAESWGPTIPQDAFLSLGLYALLRSGEDPADAVIDRGFERLLAHTPKNTRALGAALMALSARRAPTGEREHLRGRRIEKETPRKLEPKELAFAERCARRLAAFVQKRPRARHLHVVHASFGPDLLSLQWIAEGLWHARLCGVRVDAAVFEALRSQLIETARDEPGNPFAEGEVIATPYVTEGALTGLGGKPPRIAGALPISGTMSLGARPRWWAHGDDAPSTFGNCAAALRALHHCMLALGEDAETREFLGSALYSCARSFSARANLGHPYYYAGDRHLVRWLYGHTLERLAVAQVGTRDVAFELALHTALLFEQQGRTGKMDEAAFGLMLLRPHELPAVITPRDEDAKAHRK